MERAGLTHPETPLGRAALERVVAATGCAVRRGGFVFLRDTSWGARELGQFARLEKQAAAMPPPGDGWLCLPTGGTGGTLRFARHDERTLSAAVAGFCAHFGLARVNAADVLPAHHVSGFMARARCAATGGAHLPCAWGEIARGHFPGLAKQPDGWVLSLVPTQLQRLLDAGRGALEWLRRFRVIFIGGGPAWRQVIDKAARARLPLVLSYGMTETAAMIAAQREGDFAAGDRSSGRVMPHARVEICDAETGAVLPRGKTGLVRVSAASLFRGYFPETRAGDFHQTDDLARRDARGGLRIAGRRDAVIVTGGKKVMPAEVEEVLRAGGCFSDVAVVGVPDAEWGSKVVACHPAGAGAGFDRAGAEAALCALAKYKWPKAYVALGDWPLNAQGKLNRAALAAAARAATASRA